MNDRSQTMAHKSAGMDDDRGGYRKISDFFNVSVFDEILESQTAKLPKLNNVEQLSPRVLRILGQNPGKVRIAG
jgi:hypothetical protein